MVSVYDREELRANIKAKFASKQWWILAQGNSTKALHQIEERFYSGEANADFHAIIAPDCPTFWFAVAHKERMAAADFNEFAEEIGLTTRLNEEQDILLFATGEAEDLECRAFMAWLLQLLEGG